MPTVKSTLATAASSDIEPDPATKPRIPVLAAVANRSSSFLVVVEQHKDWPSDALPARCMTVAEYLALAPGVLAPGTPILNLCRNYRYLSDGYYCSLLAEARGHRVYPSVKTINDLSRKAAYRIDTGELDLALDAVLAQQDPHAVPSEFTLDIFFGRTDFDLLAGLACSIFETFPAPLMRVEFERSDSWHISAIKMQSVAALDMRQHELLAEALETFRPAVHSACGTRKWRYQLAILQDPDEALPPSNPAALHHFIEAGRELDMHVTLIDKKDYADLARYDALFIRETTAINHHTYLFAKKAEAEGLVVIDDPTSILRCTNKIYLANLLWEHSIPTPRTFVLQREQLEDIEWLEQQIGYPMVMKVPDGAFSRGVSKAADRAEFQRTAQELLKHSSLILVQEYLYTDFDWRIGVLNREVIYASQYFMSKGHWQVAKRDAEGKAEFGASRSVPLDTVPPEILQRALQAAGLIGDSLYGVDMKMSARGAVVIEVNDNPNLDAGNEDSVLGSELYRTVLRDLIRRIELQRAVPAGAHFSAERSVGQG